MKKTKVVLLVKKSILVKLIPINGRPQSKGLYISDSNENWFTLDMSMNLPPFLECKVDSLTEVQDQKISIETDDQSNTFSELIVENFFARLFTSLCSRAIGYRVTIQNNQAATVLLDSGASALITHLIIPDPDENIDEAFEKIRKMSPICMGKVKPLLILPID